MLARILLIVVLATSCYGTPSSEGLVPTVVSESQDPLQALKSDEAKYVVGLLNTPSAESDLSKAMHTISMTTASGKKFSCVIPNPAGDIAVEKTAPPESESVAQPKVDFAKNLKKLSKKCYTKVEGYWTYEVCPFNHVRQFHQEGQSVGMQVSLGAYDPKLDQMDRPGVPYMQHYIGGTDNRKATVSYVCNNAKPSDSASSNALNVLSVVKEPSIHNYELTFLTPEACVSATTTNEPSALDLLLSQKGQCIFLNTGWWAYKFCFFESLEQLHRENVPDTDAPQVPGQQQRTKIVTTQSYDLGNLQKDASATYLKSITKTHPSDNPLESYISQQFVGGTPCDITGRPRQTEVRFYCEPNEQGNLFRQIKESATCEYVATIGTRSLCNHKLFKPAQPKVHEIVCSPTDVLRAASS